MHILKLELCEQVAAIIKDLAEYFIICEVMRSGGRCEFTACQEVVCHQVLKSIATLSPFLQHKKVLVQAGVQLNVELLFI